MLANSEILPMEMQVEDLDDGVTMVALRGRLDMVGAGEIDLKFSAVAGSKRCIVVDMSAVEFLASLGIRVLVMGAKAVRNKGGKLVLLSPQDSVNMVLVSAGIDEIIPVLFDQAAAVAAVRV
jgi:anti-anti-sigma factor